MTDSMRPSRSIAIRLAIVVLIAAGLSIPISGEAAGARLLASLRIARPKPVSANVPVVATPNNREVQNVVAGILAETTAVALDEPDQSVPTADSAAKGAGFAPRLLRGRSDPASFTVLGAHRLTARVNQSQLRTLLTEAGLPVRTASGSLDGASFALATPRAVRVQYGNCPAPVANTLQNQINGPPPPSTDNGNCVMLTQTPFASATLPAALDSGAVMEIALELSGMSPNQTRDFRRLFDWRAALTMSPPRFMRSYEMVNIGGGEAPGMLMITGGRRGPTYELAWVSDGLVFSLSGYGSSADGLPLARSVGR